MTRPHPAYPPAGGPVPSGLFPAGSHRRPVGPFDGEPGPAPVGPFPRGPSGLFPAGPLRPTYREAHRVRPAAVLLGVGATAVWLIAFGLLAGDLQAYVWWTVVAGVLAWLSALVLLRAGDRGIAIGIAIATGVGWAAAALPVAISWAVSGDWPLW